jgi:hypothetical protein
VPNADDEQILELATQQENPGYANSGIAAGSNMGAQGDSGLYIPPPKKKELNFERGITFQYPFSTQYHNLWEMWKTDKVSVKQLEVMRRTDGHARALYRAITLPILACLKTATITPISGVEGGQDEAQFIDMMLNLPPAAGGMTVPLNQFMRQMLLGTFHGFSAFEMVYWVPKKGPLAGKITLRKASYRPADSVHFLSNDQGEFAGWRQRIFLFGRYIDVELPNETALVYTCNSEEGPIYGVSMFESAFWHYDKKVKLYYLAHLAAQKGALGTRIGTMPPNPNKADKDHFLRALNELGVKQYMAMPIDWTVTSLQEAGKFDFLPLIDHHNQMMSESVLCNSVLDSNSGGTNAPMVDFSSNDDTLFIQMLESVMDDIASVINNQLIPRFIDWNFGTGLYPQFRWGPFTDEQKDAIRLAFNSLAMAPQINLAPEVWQALQMKWGEDLGINVDYDAIQKEWTEKNEQQATLDSLNYQTQLIQAHSALELAANPPALDPATGQPIQPGVPPAGSPSPAPQGVAPKPAAPKPSTPGQKTQVVPAQKAGPTTKIAKAKTAAAGTHTAAKKAATAAKQNSGNPNPSQGAKQLSPKSAAQKEQDRKKERARGH